MAANAFVFAACSLFARAEAHLPATGYVSVALPRRHITQKVTWQSRFEEKEDDVLKPDEEALHTLDSSSGNPPLCLATHPNPALSGFLIFVGCHYRDSATRLTFDQTEEGSMTVKTEGGSCLGVHETLLQLVESSPHESIKLVARVELQPCTGHVSQRFVFLPAASRNYSTPSVDRDVSSGSICLEAHTMFCWNFYQMTAFSDSVQYNMPRGLVVSNHALRFELQIQREAVTMFWETPSALWFCFVLGCFSSCAGFLALLGLCLKQGDLRERCFSMIQGARTLGVYDLCSHLVSAVKHLRRADSKQVCEVIDMHRGSNARAIALVGLLSLAPLCLVQTRNVHKKIDYDWTYSRPFSDDSLVYFLVTPVLAILLHSTGRTRLQGKILDGLNLLMSLAMVMCLIIPRGTDYLLRVSDLCWQYRTVQVVAFGNTMLNGFIQWAITLFLFWYRSQIYPIKGNDTSFHPDFRFPRPHVWELLGLFVMSWAIERERQQAAQALVLAQESKLHVQVFQAMMSCYCDMTVVLDSQLRIKDGGTKLCAILFQTGHEPIGVDFAKMLLPSSRDHFADCVKQLQGGDAETLVRLHVEFRSAFGTVVKFRLDACAWKDAEGEMAFLLGLSEDGLMEPSMADSDCFPLIDVREALPSSAKTTSLSSSGSTSSRGEFHIHYTMKGDILQSNHSFKKLYGFACLRLAFAVEREFEAFMEWHRKTVHAIMSGEHDESDTTAVTAPVALLRNATRNSSPHALYECIFAVTFHDNNAYTEESEELWVFSATIIRCRRADGDYLSRTSLDAPDLPAASMIGNVLSTQDWQHGPQPSVQNQQVSPQPIHAPLKSVV
eukprot:TRINITY_DN10426_c0_g1_i1.p1 TRINITY_DN10426_c0_g1~~TRINITY_DN10426_c0_g1_i1.p1  ORF type:complete len:836 (+),score=59.89 TRINITY_DN10426_c0_g1_i1:108-2615(+)